MFVVPALMPFAAWLGAATGYRDAAAWFPLFFLFVLLPACDYALGHDPFNPAPELRPIQMRHALGLRFPRLLAFGVFFGKAAA